MTGQQNKIIIYETAKDTVAVEVLSDGNTVWLTQQQIALLFDSSRTNIVEHIKHIYIDEELPQDSTCRNFRQVQMEGKREVARELPHYNLDMILSVGYRVNSKRATHFRRWASDVLKRYLLEGVAVHSPAAMPTQMRIRVQIITNLKHLTKQ